MFSKPLTNSSPYPDHERHTAESSLGSHSIGRNTHLEAQLEPASVVPPRGYEVWEKQEQKLLS